jgi:hypothetical protein
MKKVTDVVSNLKEGMHNAAQLQLVYPGRGFIILTHDNFSDCCPIKADCSDNCFPFGF